MRFQAFVFELGENVEQAWFQSLSQNPFNVESLSKDLTKEMKFLCTDIFKRDFNTNGETVIKYRDNVVVRSDECMIGAKGLEKSIHPTAIAAEQEKASSGNKSVNFYKNSLKGKFFTTVSEVLKNMNSALEQQQSSKDAYRNEKRS